jgi:Uma2 family endonuclease
MDPAMRVFLMNLPEADLCVGFPLCFATEGQPQRNSRVALINWYEMATAPRHLVGENEYLHTSYRPDCDYVDGFVLERNLGTHPHGRLQTLIAACLLQHERQWQIHAVVEVRLKIRARKYRVPDVMVLRAAASYPAVIEQPPLLCIEIVSPDDKLPDLVIRAGDYLSMGVPITWIFHPETKQAFLYSDQGTVESSDPVLRHGQIELPIAELLEQL